MIVAVSADGVRLPLPRARVTDIAKRVVRDAGHRHDSRNALISVTFVSNPRMRAMNRRHLRRNRLTDVIAFGFRGVGRGRRGPVIGDVYIAPGVARANAREHGTSAREELVRLVVHGVLHVLGYDHPEGPERTRSAMWRRQEALVRQLRA